MRILLVTDNFPPEVNAPATRGMEHAVEWVRLGAQVTVITCAPNYPQGRVHAGYRNRLFQREWMQGVEVVRVWSYMTSNKGFVRRTLDYISFAVSAFVAGIFLKSDVVVATSPQFFTAVAGSALAALKRRPWVFELRDLWPESLVAVGALSPGRTLRLLESVEMFLYRDADAIVAVTPAFKRQLVERGVQGDKIRVIPNGADLNVLVARPPNPALVEQLGLTGKFVVGYLGTHGMAHALHVILEAAAKVSDPRIHFLFVGDGAEKAGLQDRALRFGLRNVMFHPPISKGMVPDYLALMDVTLAPLKKNDTFKTVIPSKMFESAAMGRPVLLGVEGQAKEILDEYGFGLAFAPEDVTDFLDQLDRMVNEPGLYASLQDGCARLARGYDRSQLAGAMLAFLDEVAAKGRSSERRTSDHSAVLQR